MFEIITILDLSYTAIVVKDGINTKLAIISTHQVMKYFNKQLGIYVEDDLKRSRNVRINKDIYKLIGSTT